MQRACWELRRRHLLQNKKVLGVQWNFVSDQFVLDLREIATLARNTEANTRNVVDVTVTTKILRLRFTQKFGNYGASDVRGDKQFELHL